LPGPSWIEPSYSKGFSEEESSCSEELNGVGDEDFVNLPLFLILEWHPANDCALNAENSAYIC